MESLEMEYPFDSTGSNRLFDGEVHPIIPAHFYRTVIGGREFIIMEYFDQRARCQAVTLLTDINGVYVKIPLDDYQVFSEFLQNNKLPSINPNTLKLPRLIPLGETLCATALFDPESKGKIKYSEHLPVDLYVPINTHGNTSLPGTVFQSMGIVIEPNDDETYKFTTSPNNKKRDAEIMNGLNNYYIDEDGVKKYDFSMVVEPGERAYYYRIDKDGKARVQVAILIPGIHDYHITYSDFIDKKDYARAILASDIHISATWPKYRDRHDRARAFKDGGSKVLDMNFYNGQGRITSPDKRAR